MECNFPGLPMPSIVVTFAPSQDSASKVQDLTALPSRCTTHAPHWLVSQPIWVPVRQSRSRSNCTSSVRGSTSADAVLPFTVMETWIIDQPDFDPFRQPHRATKSATTGDPRFTRRPTRPTRRRRSIRPLRATCPKHGFRSSRSNGARWACAKRRFSGSTRRGGRPLLGLRRGDEIGEELIGHLLLGDAVDEARAELRGSCLRHWPALHTASACRRLRRPRTGTWPPLAKPAMPPSPSPLIV